jgi:predicted nucleotide-binding protein (sugar kinase/HSP70/actin superfamily)
MEHVVHREPDGMKGLLAVLYRQQVIDMCNFKVEWSENGIVYLDPILNLQDRKICADQMYKAWAPMLGLSREESDRALDAGFAALSDCENEIRRQARETLDQLEREDRIGIVMLGRVYHHDPGLNHEIMEEFQKLGYPVFSQSTLPLMKTYWNASSAMRYAQASSRILSTSATHGRIATLPAPITRSGLRNLRLGTPTWLHLKSPASSVDMTHQSTA